MKRFTNPETQAVFRDFLATWPESDQAAAEWLAAEGKGAVRAWARQLRRDFWNWYGDGDFSEPILGVLIRQGLRRVNWQQVAYRLLQRIQQPAPCPIERQ